MKQKILLLITLTFLVQGCTLFQPKDIDHPNILDEGFITDNLFQIKVSYPPDSDAMTMIDKRESSFFKAKRNMRENAIKKMSQYCISYNLKKNGLTTRSQLKLTDEMMKSLEENLRELSSEGFIAQEYYLEDNSAVLLFRICRNDLKQEIESFDLSPDEKDK